MPQVIAAHPPRTILELFNILPEGTRAQAINGKIYMSPAPSVSHQKIVFTLAGQMYIYIQNYKSGIFLTSPIDVFLDKENAFQPDIVFVSNSNSSILEERGIMGAPDLIIEVLSPGTKSYDLGEKKLVYEKSGVKEYWTIDALTKACTGFQLVNGQFSEFNSDKGKINSQLLRHIFTF